MKNTNNIKGSKMKEFEEKFLVINWKRMEELNEALDDNKYFPSSKDCIPVVAFKKALKGFVDVYEVYVGKMNQKYYVCNQDEPYAQKVIDIILNN